ncbi:hypothetical protein [Chthonobacter rhizosphaerae]|uniref:hypothetical protein n=1 Tax=Chthonobacter rhizosphaerae TaxID=2735553 RepID=UPI0015EF1485|nr:hypothetical protein [Chthonobacter rhizosphaerae]
MPTSRLSSSTQHAILGALDTATKRRPLAAAVIVFGASAASLAEVKRIAPVVDVFTYDDLYSPEQRRSGLPIVQSLIHNERPNPLVIVGDQRFDHHPALLSQMVHVTVQ